MLFVSISGIGLAFPCDSFYFDKGKPIERLGRKVADLNPETGAVFQDRGHTGHGGRAAGMTHQTSF
jgi:hypothetical protein